MCCDYVRGTIAPGLHLYASSTLDLRSYIDADWAAARTRAGLPLGSASTWATHLSAGRRNGSRLALVRPPRLNTEAWPTPSPNVCGCASTLMSFSVRCAPPLVFCDNILAIYLSSNPVHHLRTKHIELDAHASRLLFGARCPSPSSDAGLCVACAHDRLHASGHGRCTLPSQHNSRFVVKASVPMASQLSRRAGRS